MAEENVKVAVRVRPFNKRERARNAELIVDMKGPTTYLKDPSEPNEDARSFNFDYSYWSHDGCQEDDAGYFGPDSSHANGSKFCDQKTVYNDLGKGVLKNAWEGYNSTLFAYGQTGSGKSWSMVGYGINKGIVPQFCEEIFQGIDKEKEAGTKAEYEVTFSMLEIYNENVRDLLNPSGKKKGLRIRQHPKKGFYAEGLVTSTMGSYKAIEAKMEEGTTNRTVAATNMNATSSRAHTIVGITFVQKAVNAAGEETAKTSICNLVDLAGSERAESTGATGARLKEGAAINQSLSALGNVISALADKSAGKRVKVPFRDSVLTKLLKNALGGNSKTIMIAAISPADINYDESLSTLRYADRAKQIKTTASVNEDPTEKLIRELSEENERLKKMLESGSVQVPSGDGEDGIEAEEGMSEEEIASLKKELEEEYQAQLQDNAHAMEEMKKSFEQKLKESEANSSGTDFDELSKKKNKTAHIYNLNFDPQLSGKIIHFIEAPETKIGNRRGEQSDIALVGPSIQEQHAVLFKEGDKYYVNVSSSSARVMACGQPVTSKTEIDHNDRLMFGTTQLYVFVNPKERDSSGEKYEVPSFEMAQEEIAASSGFDMNTDNKSQDDMLLQESLMEILPAVSEANSISEELDKKKKFEAMVVSPEARGVLKGKTEVFVKMTDLESGHEWVWPKEKFLNRKFVMQEMYDKFEDDEDWKMAAEDDPFEEDPEAETQIGCVKIWLKSLSYQIEIREQLEITDFRGNEMGLLNVEIIPCNNKGKEYTEADDKFVDSAQQLIGQEIHFLIKILSARGLPNKYTDVFARYVTYTDVEYTSTEKIPDTSNPNWNFTKQFSYKPASKEFVDYLSNSAIMVQILGEYKPPKSKKAVNTREAMQKNAIAKGMSAANTNNKMVDPNKVRLAMEVHMLRKKQERLDMKMNQWKEMVKTAEQHNKMRISVPLIKDLLYASSQDSANKALQRIPKEKEEGPVQSSTCTIL